MNKNTQTAACPTWCTAHLDTEGDEPGVHRHVVSELVEILDDDSVLPAGPLVHVAVSDDDCIGDAQETRAYASDLLKAVYLLDAINAGATK